jgi:hypothetical protein
MLYRLWEINNAQLTGTEQAIGDLREGLRRAKFPRLSKPHVFLAFSERADESVRRGFKRPAVSRDNEVHASRRSSDI